MTLTLRSILKITPTARKIEQAKKYNKSRLIGDKVRYMVAGETVAV